jgi:gliding motility-associated-like protein
MKLLNIILLLSITYTLSSQTIKLNDGLVAYFPFDGYPLLTSDKSGNGNRLVMGGDSTLGCGVLGNALRFDGISTESIMIGPAVFDNFKTADFSISFYFKPATQAGAIATYDIIAKRKNCGSDSSFAIRYTPATNQISVELNENVRNRSIVVQKMDYARCWQHVVVKREFNKLALYINGRLAQTSLTTKRIAINNDAALTLSKSPCIGSTDRKFAGFIDELRIYDRALNDDEAAALYTAPDQIANRDTIIFLGNSIKTNITTTCSTDFSWTPKEGVLDDKNARTTITPTKGGEFKYVLVMKEQQCTAIDTLKIKVIDPKDLECNSLFVPKAFTPNGDGLNDAFFISNPYAIDEVLAFEILDGWGGRIFYTQDRFERWDGTFNGQKLSPGVFLWKVKYKCKGVEKVDFGSVTLLK